MMFPHLLTAFLRGLLLLIAALLAVASASLAAPPAVAAPPASRLYRMPWSCGESYIVLQGVGPSMAPWSTLPSTHVEDERFATDFGLPEGTPVLASRAGTVQAARSDSHVGAFDPAYEDMANFVVVDHADGTAAGYWHLQYHSVIVRVGQRVSQGQMLARSGSTGWVTGPHLHFYVGRLGKMDVPWPSVEAPLIEVPDNDGLPLGGESYVSSNGCPQDAMADSPLDAAPSWGQASTEFAVWVVVASWLLGLYAQPA